MINHDSKETVEELVKLMQEHPDMRVIAWIDSEGIDDEYSYYAGSITNAWIETIALNYEGTYMSKEDDVYEDCYNIYGCECDDWTDEELEQKAKEIPWEEVITVRVSAV